VDRIQPALRRARAGRNVCDRPSHDFGWDLGHHAERVGEAPERHGGADEDRHPFRHRPSAGALTTADLAQAEGHRGQPAFGGIDQELGRRSARHRDLTTGVRTCSQTHFDCLYPLPTHHLASSCGSSGNAPCSRGYDWLTAMLEVNNTRTCVGAGHANLASRTRERPADFRHGGCAIPREESAARTSRRPAAASARRHCDGFLPTPTLPTRGAWASAP
jgi:hypothetical protein